MKLEKLGPYTLVQTLHQGHDARLFRARRGTDDRPVLLEVHEPPQGFAEDASRLRHAHEMGKTLDPAIVAAPLALEWHDGKQVLVLEDMGGEPLDLALRASGGKLEVEPFLRLAIAIAAALGGLHRQGVIHKDIKPESILVCLKTSEVRLSNLGIATRLPCAQSSARSPRQIEGSLPYMSPEQTGRVNRPMDSRTDLYSLGVTFYEMLTGKLPFDAKEPLEWIHCHVARLPPSLSEVAPGLPAPVAAIVMKLLQKAPSERYQTALGLSHDLCVCLDDGWRAGGSTRSRSARATCRID